MKKAIESPFAKQPSRYLADRTILQIIPSLDAGGAERTTVDIAEGLANHGARALVATEGGRLIPELQAKGGIWLPFPAATKNPLKILANLVRLRKICLEENVDIIHARSRAPAWTALMTAKLLKIPFVTTYHGSYAGRSAVKILYNSVMARGDIVIANSHYTASLIRKLHPFAAAKIVVIHRGTDLKQFLPAAITVERIERLRKEWGVDRHHRIILLAARLTNWKGQKVLIRAAKLLVDRGMTDIMVVLAGDPQGRSQYVRELESLIEELNLKKHVKIVGHCTDMPTAFAISATVAVPSTEPEAFGRTAVEAQAMGTPVIVSSLGAVTETVLAIPENSEAVRTGWLTPPNSPEKLAETLEMSMNLGPNARERLADACRKHVEVRFSLERMVDNTLDVYSTICDRT
ncbi:MAG: glycosyltransferase family 4 protein [Hyphomicrobiales bacterium]